MASIKKSVYSQAIHFYYQNIYRLSKKMSFTLTPTAVDITRLSTDFMGPYNNNNIN